MYVRHIFSSFLTESSLFSLEKSMVQFCVGKLLLFIMKILRYKYINCGVTHLTFWSRNYFLILAHHVYKILIIQEPNTLEL